MGSIASLVTTPTLPDSSIPGADIGEEEVGLVEVEIFDGEGGVCSSNIPTVSRFRTTGKGDLVPGSALPNVAGIINILRSLTGPNGSLRGVVCFRAKKTYHELVGGT